MKDFVEYLQEQGVSLEKRGMSWWCSCPFHKDNTPSMQVTHKDKGYMWYCFSCKRGGGPAKFISEHENVPEHEAKRIWAQLSGVEVKYTDQDLLTKVVESMCVNGHPYLRDRGITDETCKAYRIGYCDDYQAMLRDNKLGEAEAESLGLFDISGCIVFPFYDSNGVYKIAARTVSDKRYRNSSKDARFYREGLWGLNLLRGDTAWVFEGYHDAMIARQMGYQSVAACGTNMDTHRWEELKALGITRVIFAPDGDAGGWSWLERLSVDSPSGMLVEFVVLQHGDPDDLLLSGEFQKLPTTTPFEWSVRKWGETKDLAEKMRMVKAVSKTFLRMPKEQRSLAKQWFKEKFGDDEALSFLVVDIKPDLEAERVVLANALYSNNARLEAVRDLESWCFNGKMHGSLWELIRDREATPQMALVDFGVDLSDSVDLINYRYYIDKIKDVGLKSKVSKIIAEADPGNVGRLVEDLYAVSDGLVVEGPMDLATSFMDEVNNRVNSPCEPGVPIPSFPTLNKVLLGMMPQRLFLVSGNSGHGKTTMACNIANDLIDEHETLFVTLEMTDKEIFQKMVCIRSGIPSAKITTGSLEQFEYDEVLKAAESLSRSKLHVIYGENDLFKLVSLIRAHAMRKKTRFVFIDYIQLISVPTKEDRWDQLARITKTLKTQVCQKLDLTCVALTQLKRSSLNSDVPDAADQAGAYAMLADADHALTCRKVDPKDTKDGSNYLLHLSKNRFGLDSIVIPASFDRVTQRISEIGG